MVGKSNDDEVSLGGVPWLGVRIISLQTPGQVHLLQEEEEGKQNKSQA